MTVMQRSSRLSLAVLGTISLAVWGEAAVAADSLGTIQVESTTIDDRFENKREEPSSIAAISGEEVDRSHTENIQQLLQSIPGVTTEVQSGDSLKIHIRGVENQRFMGEKPGVAVVIDGVPVFERTGKVNIDLDNIESIKVVKGGASYLFGDDALSGAVIITTKRGAKYDGVTVAAEGGSFGYKKGLARVGYGDEKSNGHVQLSRREADGYYEDSDYKVDYVNGKLQYYLTDYSDATFGFELSDREKDSHGSVTGVTAAEEDPESTSSAYNDYARQFDVELQKYFVTYAKDFDVNSNLLLNAYQFTDNTNFISSPTKEDPDIYRYNNDYEQTQQGIKSEWRTGGERLAWLAAAEVRDNRYENTTTYRITETVCRGPCTTYTPGYLYEDNSTDEGVYAAYGEAKFRVTSPFTMTVNGRYDRIELDYTDKKDSADSGDRVFDVTSWRLGGNYAMHETLDFFGNISTGFRAPSVEQLFTGDYSTTGITEANADLDPEYAINYEVGVRSKSSLLGRPVDIDLTLFRIDRDDYIMSTTGQYAGPSGWAGTSEFDNIGGMRNQGLELAISSDPVEKWSWEVAYTYLDAEFTDYEQYNLMECADPEIDGSGNVIDCNNWNVTEINDLSGNDVPRAPEHHLNLISRYRLMPDLLLTGEIDYQSEYYADELNRFTIEERTVFNLLANYDVKSAGGQRWSFFMRVDNVLDEDYYNTARGFYDSNYDGSFDEEDLSLVVNQGRTFTAGLSASF